MLTVSSVYNTGETCGINNLFGFISIFILNMTKSVSIRYDGLLLKLTSKGKSRFDDGIRLFNQISEPLQN